MSCGHGPMDPATKVLNDYIEREYEAFAHRAGRLVKDRLVHYIASPGLETAVRLANAHQVQAQVADIRLVCPSCRVNFKPAVAEMLDQAEAGKKVFLRQLAGGSLALMEQQ